LVRVSRALGADFDRTNNFATLFHAQLEPRTGQVTFVDAGHGYAVLRRATGETEILTPRNLPFGLIEPASFAEGRAILAPGDALIVYSDGVLECWPDTDVDSLWSGALTDAHEAEQIVESILADVGPVGDCPDDLTVMVLARSDVDG